MRPAPAIALLGALLAVSPAQARKQYPAQRAEGLTPALKQRIYRAGVRHLTLDDRALATALARQPELARVTRWTAGEVARLRTVGALPTVPRKNELLADLSARLLERLPASASLQVAADRIASQQPGVTVESLTHLARYNPRLARARRGL